MKRMLALLLAAMLILTLLPGCGKKDPGGDAPEVPENPSEQGGETPDVTPEPEPYVDPYEAVRTYWSEDQLTQSWGPDQVVEHLFVPSRHRLSPVGISRLRREPERTLRSR